MAKGKHTSLDKDLKKIVSWIEQLPHVKKVILSFTESCRHKYPSGHIRLRTDVDAGVKASGYFGNGVIDMVIVIDPLDERENVKITILNKVGNRD